MRTRIEEIKPITGIESVLAELHEQGHTMYVASSNLTRNVHHFLERYNLAHYFAGVHGGIGLFDKAGALRKVAKEHGFAPEDAIYIGDEARDVEATRKVGMRCVSVTWGFNNLKGLEGVHPQEVVNTPKDLLEALQTPTKPAG